VLDGGLESQDLSFSQAIRVLRKRRRIIFLTALLCFVITLAGSLILRPHYKSAAEIEIEHDQSNALENTLGATAAAGTVPDDPKVQVQTEVNILQSEDLALETIEKTHFESHEGLTRSSAEQNLPLSQAPIARKKALQKFSHQLSVGPQEGTRLIQVAFTDRDPKYAASVTMAFLDQYIQDRLRRRNSSTLLATDWIGNQIAEINKRLETTQKALADYQKQSGLVSLPTAVAAGPGAGAAVGGGSAVRSPSVDRLIQLNQGLVTVQTERIAREAIYKTVQSGNPDTVATVASSQLATNQSQDPTQAAMFTGLMNLRQQQGNLQSQLTTARQTYGPKNPHLLDLEKQAQGLDKQIRDEVKAIVSRAYLDYQTALKNENGMRAAYNQALKETEEANGREGHLSVLQQEADSTRTLYEDLYTKLEQARLSIGTQASNVALISQALPSSQPAYPKPVLYALVSLFAGLFIGVVLAFLVEGADDSIVTSIEVENLTALPVLASIPEFASKSGARQSKTGEPLSDDEVRAASSVIYNPRSAAAEAFRTLRVSLMPDGRAPSPMVLLVTSPLPQEGRTSIAYNLGCSFAITGEKVLLIDADLRNPALHLFANVSNSRGLSNWLSSSENLPGSILSVQAVSNLSILPAGPEISNPSESLASGKFEELLRQISTQFTVVLIDTPPLMIVSDAAVLSGKVDGVLLVARSGSTTSLVLMRTVQKLRRLGANILGVSLNRVDTSSSEYYYSNGFRGSDGKGYHVN
jgi:capsular exopolysaccharide synthesis family protein